MSDALGIGMLIGLQHRQKLNEQDFAAERKRLQSAMAAAQDNLLSEKAQKEAAKACIAEVLDEITTGRTRRHSDPDAAAARGQDFIDTAEDYLNRLSDGRLSFSGPDVDRIKRSGADLRAVATQPQLKPKVVRNAAGYKRR